MKKKHVAHDDDYDPLDREIDFSNARPNPYFLGVVDRTCVRVIDKDLADRFPDNASVNAALRFLADAGERFAPKAPPVPAKHKRSAKTAQTPKSPRKKVRS